MPFMYREYRSACLFDDDMDRNRRMICGSMDKKAVIEALKKEYGMAE